MPFCGGAFVVGCWLLVGGCWLVVYMPGTLVAIRLGKRGNWFWVLGFGVKEKRLPSLGRFRLSVSLVCVHPRRWGSFHTAFLSLCFL